jgi:Domain of unknown function (DUF4249)
MKYIFFITATILILSSCERETHINIPPQIPKLVAESRQGQNVLPEARISRTRGVTDPLPLNGQPDQYVVKNAIALLYENDVLKDTLKYNNGTERYKATITTIQAGRTYKLVLTAPNFPGAEAISFTPVLVPINNLTFTRNVRVDADGNSQDEVKLSFTDNGATEDYYLLRIMDAYGDWLYCVNTNDKDVEKLVYEDPFYPDDCLQSDRLLLSDKNFNGATKTLIFYADAGSLDQQIISPGTTRKATVELLHINKDYYKYIRSLNSYENAVDNPFAEPVNLYSNVKNGYGLFTTYAMAVDSIR